MKAEFQIGDTVHFRCYKYHPVVGLEATVSEIKAGRHGNGRYMDGAPDQRIFYMIRGPYIISSTTGESLIESALFEPPTE